MSETRREDHFIPPTGGCGLTARERLLPDEVSEAFVRYHPVLFRYLTRLTGDADLAADAAQHAFAQLLQQPPETANVKGWLFQVGRNEACQSARTRNRRKQLLARSPGRTPLGDAPLICDEVLERKDQRVRVQRALGSLSRRDRTAVMMRIHGYSHREIAAAIGAKSGSVGTIIARALKKLVPRLQAELDDR